MIKTNTSLCDFETRSTQDHQIHTLRDVLQHSLDNDSELLQNLLPKDSFTSQERVLNTFYHLKLPKKNFLEVETENPEYLKDIMSNYNNQKYLIQEAGLPQPVEPPVLGLKYVKTTPLVCEEDGCKLYSYIRETHLKVTWNKEVNKHLFH